MTTATVVGGGPAGLIAAEVLARAGVDVVVHDRMPSVGRKFLLAGHGGLNITHTEGRDAFVARYGAAADRLRPMLDVFGPGDLRAWCAGLGEETVVGSSGRVFPRSFRATPLMRAWLARLAELGVRIEKRRRWVGWSPDGASRFTGADGTTSEVGADVTVFALGGASWPRLGADGDWVGPFTERGIEVTPLRAANVGVRVAWTEVFAQRFAGTPLKNVALTVRGRPGVRVRGDAMLTSTGLEGGPVYALGAAIREVLDAQGRCVVEVDLRPDLTVAQLDERLQRRRPKDSGSSWLRRTVGLDPAGIGLLREARAGALPSSGMAERLKAVPVVVTDTMPMGKAISTAGGIAWSQVDGSLMLRALPGTFVAGEMLDWEAPTGGYLLQASFSTGVVAAHGALARLGGAPVGHGAGGAAHV
ncbi:TIGR03862 family flavoprotein [Cellulomonas sp. zg-ZUI199]|uniref:TIGR03862 family flavoprotein n=1 Tax=Cellulomonas wangleii TaxID=2816956 RepID=A0ABX8D7V4_9CELL|nr:TIGR03862 family flavoprotein [Cellulomonas wangleii]MBO0925087.1 TIGR03862 family flavoprotein [Cellulomonas wangleii]QVI63499.1 TIGR03862 family flavoprotein [Cellulomonas wangleii]